MAIRDTLRTNAQPFLGEGETIESIFGAQTTSPYFALLSAWIVLFKVSYRVIVVTDRRILVCKSGRFRSTPVKEVLRELPRSTKIGPWNGIWFKPEGLGERLYVHKRYQKDVEAADAGAGRS